MKTLKTSLLALGSALLLTTSFSSFAAPGVGGDACPMAGHGAFAERMQMMHERMQARLHDQLKLTPEQEPAWQAFIKDGPPHLAMMAGKGEDLTKLSAPERAEKMLARMKEAEAAMAKHTEALKTFYATLNAEQKKTFDNFHPLRDAKGKKGFFGRAPYRGGDSPEPAGK